jgi:hypothetical protein
MSTLKHRILTNLLLLTIVLGLLALVLWEHRTTPQPVTTRLLALEAAAIHTLHIDRPGQAALILQRQANDAWRMLSPITIEASGFRIESLLRISQLSSLGSFPATEANLADYRLAEPLVTLTLNDQYRLDFGGQTALDHRRYVRLDDTIHIVPDTLFYHLIGEPQGFIAHRLLPEGMRITAITLPGLRLVHEAGQWQAHPPEALRSVDQIQSLLDAWRHAGVIQVRPYDGQEGPSIYIELEDASLKFLLTEHQGEPVLARPDLGIQYHLSQASAEPMLRLPP